MSTVQNHIHIDTTVSGSGEKAPPQKWIVHDRREIPVIFLNIKRTKTGKLRPNIILNAGNPVEITNFQYELRVRNDGVHDAIYYKALVKSMLGKTVYLVDSEHCDDGVDHTAFVKTMFFSEISNDGFGVDHWGLEFYYCKIQLEDYSL